MTSKPHLYYITGSSSGIGKALSEECLSQGHYVIGISRTQNITHENYRHLSLDLTDQAALVYFKFSPPESNFSRIVLVNNAGTVQPVKAVGKASPKDLVDSVILNLAAPLVLTNEFFSQFDSYKVDKLIINISSGAAKRPIDGWMAYCTTKAGLDMMTRVADLENSLNGKGIKSVAISPGVINTPMQSEIRQSSDKDFSRLEEFVHLHDNNELIDPALTAKMILESTKNLNNINDPLFSLKY